MSRVIVSDTHQIHGPSPYYKCLRCGATCISWQFTSACEPHLEAESSGFKNKASNYPEVVALAVKSGWEVVP